MLVCPDVLVGDSLERLRARFGARVIDVSEAEIRSYATNGLPIGDTLLAPSLVPERVRSLVTSLGMNVRLLPIDELCGRPAAPRAASYVTCRTSTSKCR